MVRRLTILNDERRRKDAEAQRPYFTVGLRKIKNMILTLIIIFREWEIYGTAIMVHNSGVEINPI